MAENWSNENWNLVNGKPFKVWFDEQCVRLRAKLEEIGNMPNETEEDKAKVAKAYEAYDAEYAKVEEAVRNWKFNRYVDRGFKVCGL